MPARAANPVPEISMTRTLDAPRELVFRAFGDPAMLVRWFGPRGFSLPVCEVDFRPGGRFRYVMRGPDGTDYPGESTFDELVPPERIVWTGTAVGIPGTIRTEITLREAGANRTTIHVHQTFSGMSPAVAGAQVGWSQTLDRLHEAVCAGDILITRRINAVPAVVFEAFSDPQRLGQWWGPNGFTTTTHQFDFRPGGEWRFTMHGPLPSGEVRDFRSRIVYQQIQPPERIAFQQFGEGDDAGVSHQTDVRFTAVADGTEISLRMTFKSAADRERVAREYGAIEGAQQTLNRLNAFLTREVQA